MASGSCSKQWVQCSLAWNSQHYGRKAGGISRNIQKLQKNVFKGKWFIANFFMFFAAATPARCFSCEECCSCTIGLFEEVVVLQASNCRLQIGPANVILDFLWVLVLCYFPSGLAVDMHQCPNFSHSKHGCRVQVLKNL